jgi:DNA-binding GntR family transcriptional regulator
MEIMGVTKTLVAHLREQIITDELPAGQKLNEFKLAESLGVSRPPLREAFRILEHEHLVLSVPRKGTFVTEVSLEDLIEVYQAREMIELHAIDLLKKQDIRELPLVESALAMASSLSLPEEHDRKGKLDYLKAFAGYHVKLVESAENKRLIYFYQAIDSNLARYQFMYAYIPGLTKHSQEDHMRIIQFIRQGRYEDAKECLRAHINSFIVLMEGKISKEVIDAHA